MISCAACGEPLRVAARFCSFCGRPVGAAAGTEITSRADIPTPLPGTLLAGRYALRQEIGRGGFGIVYDAWDGALEREIAVKTIHFKHLIRNEELSEVQRRFKREARAAGKLSHRNIVAILDYGVDGEVSFIAMERARGEALDELVANMGQKLRPRDAREILMQILDALGHAHAHGVIHRDVKPANVIVDDSGKAVLTDFGIAKIESTSSTDTTIVGANRIAGSPGYLAPEVIAGHPVDARSDLYAVAVLAFWLFTGRRPFEGTMPGILEAIRHRPPPDPRSLEPRMPPLLGAWILRGLAKSPDQRLPSAEMMRRGLDEVASDIDRWDLETLRLETTVIGGIRIPRSHDAERGRVDEGPTDASGSPHAAVPTPARPGLKEAILRLADGVVPRAARSIRRALGHRD